MTLYEVTSNNLTKIEQASFEQVGLRERNDLQRLLRKQIDVILPDTLVIAEEFGEWEESKRRIDLLGLDKEANLVVIELKRTDDGGHMELQAIRYAAMVSTMTFDRTVDIYERYLAANGDSADARAAILDFLGWDEPDEDYFAQDVRIVLVSANFSKELTTTVMWLNKRDLDIRCIRLVPYHDKGRVLIDVQQVVPLPEAAEYQIQIREKEQKERQERVERTPLRTFWMHLLALGEGRTPLHERMTPHQRDYMSTNAGASGLSFGYVVGRYTSRVELYIDRGDAAINKRVYDELLKHKGEIEAIFGTSLLWQRLDAKRACRIAYEIPLGGYKDDEAKWHTIQAAMIDAMVNLEKALSPFIPQVARLR
ncbi:MAG TPA: DUF4268 domain-containing protein [Pyrinomonadaceae bacterium]|nr:DUF4268 domain-containing protein [Pyrinomonadaceae bacterium]